MNEPIGVKKPPEVKPWVRRVVEAAGVFVPENADGEGRLGWWGGWRVFLSFACHSGKSSLLLFAWQTRGD